MKRKFRRLVKGISKNEQSSLSIDLTYDRSSKHSVHQSFTPDELKTIVLRKIGYKWRFRNDQKEEAELAWKLHGTKVS